MSAARSAPIQGHPQLLEMGFASSLPFVALAASLLSPLVAYFVGLGAIFCCARLSPRLLPLALVAFANAGAMVFASRSFVGESVDFENYWAAFDSVCRGLPMNEGLFAFGEEVGLTALYTAMSWLGSCTLSIAGLAYVQGLIISIALLLVLAQQTRPIEADRRAVLLTGLALLFSFFFVTQLSRQALASVFLLHALFNARSHSSKALWVVAAGLCHVTAPLLYGLALILRRGGYVSAMAVFVVSVLMTLAFDYVLEFAATHDSFLAVGKLLYYSGEFESAAVSSDWLTVAYLLVAAIPVLFSRVARQQEKSTARMLLGIAFVAATLLPLPLAATRFALPLGSFAAGGFVFNGLWRASPAFARSILLVLLIARLISLLPTSPDSPHALWTSHGPWSISPGYFLTGYLR